uniref:Ig-like domain-containing protein n=1 Tax=Acanthochromis polyacanthus TaxID=80966 RepID=A0A3Q1F6T4_9TELE
MNNLIFFFLNKFSFNNIMLHFTIYTCITTYRSTNITADVGENVTLTCKVHNNNKRITTVEWSRPELDPEYVLRCQYGHLDPHNQHRSYKNRVYLQDKEMKDGDVSLILMNVMKNDTGTYHCRVFQENNEPICSINLEVIEPGEFVLRVQFMSLMKLLAVRLLTVFLFLPLSGCCFSSCLVFVPVS